MTLEELRIKVREWDFRSTGMADDTAYYSDILNQLDYHAVNEWRIYLPAEHPDFHPSFMERLAKWIGNVSDEAEQKLLLEYALHISFFSHEDFVSLYQTALNREITRWMATQLGARLESSTSQALHDLVQYQIHHQTWFCPVTDSMDINEFYKVNHIKGIGHRPGFSTLQMLAERVGPANPLLATNVINYMANPSLDPGAPLPQIERIVLLEDIVGSGAQCLDSVRWAVANLGKPVLFVPLILCPNGLQALRSEELRWGGRLTVRPVIELSRDDLLGPERQGHRGWRITSAIEDLACKSAVSLGLPPEQAFGFMKTGCSLSTFSNTPDNSLPMIHYKPRSGSWEPLFPRVYRD